MNLLNNNSYFAGHSLRQELGDKLNALDPASAKSVRSIDVDAHAGTTFGGQHLALSPLPS